MKEEKEIGTRLNQASHDVPCGNIEKERVFYTNLGSGYALFKGRRRMMRVFLSIPMPFC